MHCVYEVELNAGQAAGQMGSAHVFRIFFASARFLGPRLSWVYLSVYIDMCALFEDGFGKKMFWFPPAFSTKKKQKVERYTPTNTIYWPLVKAPLAGLFHLCYGPSSMPTSCCGNKCQTGRTLVFSNQ